jgi:hypothetical protein
MRHLIGTSLSSCIRDIVSGKVLEDEVLLICTSTRHDFSDRAQWDKSAVMSIYENTEIILRLWQLGRIHQPRMVSRDYNLHCDDEYFEPRIDRLFPHANYRHSRWYSLMDQTVTDKGATT